MSRSPPLRFQIAQEILRHDDVHQQEMNAGEDIVLVVTASAHRRAAFAAAEFLMDYLKTNAPFWKKEVSASGKPGDWVASKATDLEDAQRWADRE